MAQPKAIYIYLENEEKLNTLTDAQRGRLLSAAMAYGNRGDMPDFSDDPVLVYAFLDLKNNIDRDNERYNDTCKRRAEAGRKGGKVSQANQANASFASQNQANQANASFALHEQAKDNFASSVQAKSSKSSETEAETEAEAEDIASAISAHARAKADFEERAEGILELFRKTCPTVTHPDRLTEHRRRLIYAAEKDGVDFELLFSKLRASPFLYGKPGIGFDWVMKPENRQKVLEGNYDKAKKPPNRRGSVFSQEGASFDISEYEGKGLFDD